jgi:hypothetical protein
VDKYDAIKHGHMVNPGAQERRRAELDKWKSKRKKQEKRKGKKCP